jgi:hypothetical protein
MPESRNAIAAARKPLDFLGRQRGLVRRRSLLWPWNLTEQAVEKVGVGAMSRNDRIQEGPFLKRSCAQWPFDESTLL